MDEGVELFVTRFVAVDLVVVQVEEGDHEFLLRGEVERVAVGVELVDKFDVDLAAATAAATAAVTCRKERRAAEQHREEENQGECSLHGVAPL